MTAGRDQRRGLTNGERYRLLELRDASGLSDLVPLTGVDSEHAAYFAAKREWYDLRGRALADQASRETGLPGNRVVVDGHDFHVHGITHAGSDAERSYLRRHVGRFLGDGDAVYCEQGIRPMYLADVDAVCEMDDYRWAVAERETVESDSNVTDVFKPDFDSITEDVGSLTDGVRDGLFSLIEADGVDEGALRRAIGDVASALLTSKEEMATGEDFESFRKRRRAAADPERLADLQRYYERRFLPQPVEREWLRRHDPELELVTHARNERMADYVQYHTDDADSVHLVVGAAHQPGVTYYLEQHRDGTRDLTGFDPIP